MLKYLDIFAGAGGLSEGFMRAGYEPVAHIEMNEFACYTLKTRLSYKWLLKNNKEELYFEYLKQNITRDELYNNTPNELLNTVFNCEYQKKICLRYLVM